jgi:hypothetical protein
MHSPANASETQMHVHLLVCARTQKLSHRCACVSRACARASVRVDAVAQCVLWALSERVAARCRRSVRCTCRFVRAAVLAARHSLALHGPQAPLCPLCKGPPPHPGRPCPFPILLRACAPDPLQWHARAHTTLASVPAYLVPNLARPGRFPLVPSAVVIRINHHRPYSVAAGGGSRGTL